jgi:hypothetical protein
MKLFLLAAVAACAIAAPANAATIIQNASIASSSPTLSTINFGKFDASLGVLNSVTLTFSSILDATGSITNHSLFLPRNYLLSTGGLAALAGNGFNFVQGLGIGLDLVHVGRNSSVGLNYSDSDSDSQTLTSNLNAFIGSGSVPFTFVSTNLFAMVGVNGSLSVNPLISAEAQISYDYTPGPVPEPASWAMMVIGFGVLGGAMRRRRSTVTATVRYA